MQNSTSGSGRRLAAALFLGATSAALAAGAAHADGTVTGAKWDGYDDPGAVFIKGDKQGTETALISLNVPKTSVELKTYCIQLGVDFDKTQLYDEKDWASEAARIKIKPDHLEGIKWILNNSFPRVSTTALAAASSAAHDPVSGLSDREAVEATQAAIWFMADPTGKLDLDQKAQQGSDSDDNVYQLFKYLRDTALTHMSDSGTPQASLTVTPLQTTTPRPGDKLGFKLVSSDTTEAFISVSLSGNQSGAKLLDAAGKVIAPTAKLKSGTTVYVQLPATPDKGSVTLSASGTINGIEAGRVFVNHNEKVASQNLILAQSTNVPVSVSTPLTWQAVITPPPTSPPSSTPSTPPSSHPSTTPSSTPSTTTSTTTSTSTTTTPATTPSTTPTTPTTTTTTPDTSLAHTGADNTLAIGAGALALVAAGGGMVVYTRRRNADQGTHA